jgi:hypothetical protein
MTIIKSVSITKEHDEMIKRDGISLSAVLRTALDQFHLYKTGELLETTSSMSAKIQRLTDNIERFAKFINDKGLYNEFLEQK